MLSQPASREVQSVRTAFRIVGLLQDLDGAKMNDLAEHLDLAKSTVHNYLGTLQSLGYVVERDGTYRLGLRFLTNGMAARHGLAVREAVTQALPGVAADLTRSVWWIVEEQGRGVFVDHATPDGDDPIYGRVGKRSYLHTHAPGKALLAAAPSETVEAVLDHHGLRAQTRETTTDRAGIRAELEEIRTRGFAASSGEAALGIHSVGVAFDGPAGYNHALGVFGLTHEFGAHTEERVSAVLESTVTDLEAQFATEAV